MTASMQEEAYLAVQLARHGLDDAAPANLSERKTKVGDAVLHLREWGERSQSPIVFLHGGGGSSRDWDPICASLGRKRFCAAVDQRGHGDSEWSTAADYRLTSFVTDIERLVADSGWNSIGLVGFSMGGANALAAAAELGERCSVVVLIEAAPALRDGPSIQRLRAKLGTQRSYPSLDDALAGQAFQDEADRRLAHAYYARHLRRSPSGTWVTKHDPRLVNGRGCRESPEERTQLLWAAVDRIKCPVLVVRGGASKILGDEAAAELAERLAHGRWVRIGSLGHRLSPNGARELLAALTQFLDEVMDG